MRKYYTRMQEILQPFPVLFLVIFSQLFLRVLNSLTKCIPFLPKQSKKRRFQKETPFFKQKYDPEGNKPTPLSAQPAALAGRSGTANALSYDGMPAYRQ